MSTPKDQAGLQLLAEAMEALAKNVAGSAPPATHEAPEWIDPSSSVPDDEDPVEVWNTAWDRIEPACLNLESRIWYSALDGSPYLFGAVTHWRPRSEQMGGEHEPCP